MTYLYNNRSTRDLRCKLRREQTDAEKILWHYIRAKQLGHKFLRQYSVGLYMLDFYCARKRLAVEIDGGQHNEKRGSQKDIVRTAYLNEQNISVKRYWNNEVLVNTDDVLEDIVRELEKEE